MTCYLCMSESSVLRQEVSGFVVIEEVKVNGGIIASQYPFEMPLICLCSRDSSAERSASSVKYRRYSDRDTPVILAAWVMGSSFPPPRPILKCPCFPCKNKSCFEEWTGRPGFDSRLVQVFFVFPSASRPAVGPTEPLINQNTRSSIPPLPHTS
jgi:hypothetical protein